VKNSNKKQFFQLAKDSVWQPLIGKVSEETVHRIPMERGQYFVGGFPKSGTTWICRMFANYLALPWFNMDDLVLGFNGVMHHHWNYHPSLAGTVYVLRDGRDVMVSIYMNVVKGYMARREVLDELRKRSIVRWLANNSGRFATIAKRFHYLFGKQFDPLDVQRNLPKFIDSELQKPFISEAKLPWHLHIQNWLDNSESVTIVKYEDMLDDTWSAMTDLIRQQINCEPNEADLSYITERFSFKRMTGRDPGEEDRTSFARKGISGDWRNHFNAESRQLFDEYAGDMLVELGYELDHQWIEE
jgi:hypothetical protein